MANRLLQSARYMRGMWASSFAFPLTAFAHVVILFRLQMIAVVYNFRL